MPDNNQIIMDITPVEAPIQRKLVLCHSSALPDKADRVKNYVYLVYDQFKLYIYQTLYTDPYCIIQSLSNSREILTDKMLYITMDGRMYSVSNHIVYHMGDLLDFAQSDLLTQCGTAYFMNAESRYFDKTKRLLNLPFKNGNYQLNLSLVKDLSIDENTVIRFNPDTNQFYVAGKEYQFDDRLNNLYKYSGMNTRTVETYLDGHTFRSNIRLSDKPGNDIKALTSGLFVSNNDLASKQKYLDMIAHFVVIKNRLSTYIMELVGAVKEAEETSSQETLEQIAENVLENYKHDIDDMVENYETLYERLLVVEDKLDEGFDADIEAAKDEIKAYVDNVNSPWVELEEPTGNRMKDYELDSMILNELRNSFLNLRNNDTDAGNKFNSSEIDLQNAVMSEVDNVVNVLNAGVDKV